MGIENEEHGSSEKEPKKKFKVGVEMEGYGKDGEEITGSDLWEDVIVEAANEEEAQDIVFNKMDFGNRRPNGYSEVEEIGKQKEEPPFEGVKLGK